MDKHKLDLLLKHHQAQPVGDGYIDIIISRKNYTAFVDDLVKSGFSITAISWWEYCANDAEPLYGLGGPKSLFHDGWFAELSVEVDDVPRAKTAVAADVIIKMIESKVLICPDEVIDFKTCNWLTPAVWLDVPKGWKNLTSAQGGERFNP